MTGQQQHPTREQIAATIAEYWADNDTDGSGVDDIIVDELARKIHESFALFPQPTPSAEPTCTCGHIMDDHDLSDTGECQVAIPWCPCMAAKDAAAPPSIANMAPGTRFTAAGVDNIDRRWIALPDGELFKSDVYIVGVDWLDPSTTRDVQEPPTAPEASA